MAGVALASDFDGTVFFQKRTPPISSEDLAAIRDFRLAGGLYGACTGRPHLGILHAARGTGLSFDFLIVSGGAQVLTCDGRVLQETPLPGRLVTDIAHSYRGRADVIVQANGRSYSFRPWNDFQLPISSVADIPGDVAHGVSFYTRDEEEALGLAEEIHSRWGDDVDAYPNVFTVDVVRKGCSKGTALRALKDLLGLDVMGGIGDSFNDIPMLEAADRAYTFPQAPLEARSKARVVASVAEALADLARFWKKCDAD